MTKHLNEGHSVFVTKHGKPIGITLPLNDDVFSIGVKKSVAVELFKMEVISLGKMAEILEMSKLEAMSLLDSLNLVWMDDNKKNIEDEIKKWL